MKWAIAIQRKIRLAIALAVMMLFIIIFSLIESYNVSRITKSFNSMYEDRLIPAADLYSISEQIHNKRDDLFNYLFTDNRDQKDIGKLIGHTNKKLDTLIKKFENTLLVKDENSHLQRLKENLKNLQRDELILINAAEQNKEVAKKLYLNTTIHLHEELNKNLLKLIDVQTLVGKELLAESVRRQSSSVFISQLQMVITIILGIVIMILIMTGKQVNIKQEKYKLN